MKYILAGVLLVLVVLAASLSITHPTGMRSDQSSAGGP